MLRNSMSDTSSVTMPNSMRDPKLFKDDKDIKFSKYYNSCRVRQMFILNRIILFNVKLPIKFRFRVFTMLQKKN